MSSTKSTYNYLPSATVSSTTNMDANRKQAANKKSTKGNKSKCHGVQGKSHIQVARRNERERKRVQCVNSGFVTLRNMLPTGSRHRKISKVETLRQAAKYINHLLETLDGRIAQPFEIKIEGRARSANRNNQSSSSEPINIGIDADHADRSMDVFDGRDSDTSSEQALGGGPLHDSSFHGATNDPTSFSHALDHYPSAQTLSPSFSAADFPPQISTTTVDNQSSMFWSGGMSHHTVTAPQPLMCRPQPGSDQHNTNNNHIKTSTPYTSPAFHTVVADPVPYNELCYRQQHIDVKNQATVAYPVSDQNQIGVINRYLTSNTYQQQRVIECPTVKHEFAGLY